MPSIVQRGRTFRARVRRKGQVLSRTFDRLDQAEAWAEAEEQRIASGATAAQIKRTPAGITVADLMDRYAREVSPDKGGARWEVIRLQMLRPAFQMAATSLDGAAMAEWRDGRLRQVSASTVNRELNLISAVLNRAIKEWRLPLPANPVRAIQRPKMPQHRRRRVADHERAAILAALGWPGGAAPTNRRQWVAWAFCLSLETMMRKGEVLRLTWDHVHLDRLFVHLPKTKNGDHRNVPLSSRAVALLRLLPPGQIGQRVVPVESGTFDLYFRRAVRAAGLDDLHYHDSRREALTRLAPKFGDPMQLGAASGHRDYRSLRVYFEPDPTEQAKRLG